MDIDALAEQYAKEKDHLKKLTERVSSLKDMLMSKIEATGTPDDKGHVWLEGNDWVLKREKRVSKGFDTKACLEWADVSGYDEEDFVVTVIPEPYDDIDQDALAAFAYQHRKDAEITNAIKSFHTETVTYAFAAPQRQKKVDY